MSEKKWIVTITIEMEAEDPQTDEGLMRVLSEAEVYFEGKYRCGALQVSDEDESEGQTSTD